MNTYDLPFKVYLKDNPSTLWRAASALSDEWKEFSKMCLRIVTLGTSETDVERNFSKQREIHGKHAININLKTVQSRVDLVSDANLMMVLQYIALYMHNDLI